MHTVQLYGFLSLIQFAKAKQLLFCWKAGDVDYICFLVFAWHIFLLICWQLDEPHAAQARTRPPGRA